MKHRKLYLMKYVPLFQYQLKVSNEELEEGKNYLANLEHRYVYRCVTIAVADNPDSTISQSIHAQRAESSIK